MDAFSQSRHLYRGALVGLAVGDALGTTLEFSAPGSFPPVTGIVGGGPFRLPAGAWTDDTSMAMCLAESLVEQKRFDPVDQLQRYVRWYRHGHWSSTGTCFDIGNATRSALERFERTGEPFPGDADPNAAGNGPLMKLAPVALAFALHPALAVELAGLSARTTHGAQEAADAARYFAGLIVGALRGVPVGDLLHDGVYEPAPGIWDKAPLHPKVAAVASGSFLSREPPAIKGGGYVVRALEAALWALAKTRSFSEGALLAVNLGDDADTTAAIYGQIAGAVYGVQAIPEEWRQKLLRHDEIVGIADALWSLASIVSLTVPTSPAPKLPGDSYWAVEDKLLAGPYPGAKSLDEARQKLNAFLDLGVTCFVDLTEEGEGPPLHPYAALLRKVAAKRGIKVTHMRLPIRDVDVPTSWQMRIILLAIRLAIEAGEVVYVHCWGGVGRTGTVVGCVFVDAGLTADQAIHHLGWVRRDTARAHRASPETQTQRDFIAQWAAANVLVMDQSEIDAAGITPVGDAGSSTDVPSHEQVVAQLEAGHPVVITGGPGQCVQAVGGAEGVHIEILDPVHWESGPALTDEQVQDAEALGFEHQGTCWLLEEARTGQAAAIMLTAAKQLFDIE